MKHFTLLLLLAIGILSTPAQAQRRGYAYGPTSQFHRMLKQVTIQHSDQSKMSVARSYFNNNHFTVNELNKVLFQLSIEENRVALAKEAYFLVSDVQNFKNVLYTIERPRNRQDIKYFIRDQKALRKGGGRVNNPRNVNFPALNYPNALNYNGARGCNSYMDAATFNNLSIAIFNAQSDYQRQTLINGYMSSHYFSVSQFMKMLTIVADLDIRFNLARTHVHGLYDLDHCHSIASVFGETAYRNQFLGIVNQPRNNNFGRGRNPGRHHYGRAVSELEMQTIMNNLRRQSFNSDRLHMAQVIVQSKGAFTTGQLRRIMSVFSFDRYRLQFAKFAYPYAIDRANYYLLSNELSFSSNRRALLNFIRNNP